MAAIDTVASVDRSPLEFGFATRPYGGTTVSGDHHTVCPFPGGFLIAVVDGLGHGDEAAVAGRLAIATVEAVPEQSLNHLFMLCNRALASTRGAVMSAATIDVATQTMTWAAIGNVDAALFRIDAQGRRTRHSIVMIGGVIGSRMLKLRPAALPIRPGDTIVFATDGIGAEFGDHVTRTLSPQALADNILSHCGKTTDDALVLVARWQAESHV
jgi:serine phosphatase RsbU (regulator of sigma subunit)